MCFLTRGVPSNPCNECLEGYVDTAIAFVSIRQLVKRAAIVDVRRAWWRYACSKTQGWKPEAMQ